MPTEVKVVRTNKGNYAGFQHSSPRKMAHAFGAEFEEVRYDQWLEFGLICESLSWMARHGMFDNSTAMMPQFFDSYQEELLKLQAETNQLSAASQLKDKFGEVEPEDRDSLAVLAVFNALCHNVEEARRRQLEASAYLLGLVLQMNRLLEASRREISAEIEEHTEQLEFDVEAKKEFEQNGESGYSVNRPLARVGEELGADLAVQDGQTIEMLRAEDRQLELIQGLLGFALLSLGGN